MYDRDTALAILNDLSKNMRPDCDLFGNKTLVIHRYMFENIRKKYLDDDTREAELIAKHVKMSCELLDKMKGERV